MDIICFCHIRWNFVYQRPQHLMRRFSQHNRVFFIEEPVFESSGKAFMEVNIVRDNIWIVTPHLSERYTPDEIVFHQRILLSSLYNEYEIKNYIHWFYTPMALAISNHLQPEIIIYDCMDELSNFKYAPLELKLKEKELFRIADLVFTGGYNLYEAKKNDHHNIYPFPSSIDKDHFLQARTLTKEPEEQADISRPIFGFYGVIDERFDVEIIREVASLKSEWEFVIIGPVIKIDPAILPQLNNIHYLGARKYEQLPSYLSGWDVAMIPFLLNDSTKYISPTKTPEYLAAGVPVISSSIVDVVTPYAINNLVHIADNAEDFIKAGEKELAITDKNDWMNRVDLFLKENSWDQTWSQMMHHVHSALKGRKRSAITLKKESAYV
jgi:glycosyltransferase involved in cell wall biosynthesis